MQRGPWRESAYEAESFIKKPGGKPPVKPLGEPTRKAPKALEDAVEVHAPVEAQQDENTIPSPVTEKPGTTERLQKVLARAGIASRRKAELLILEGAVTVNGRPVVELGTKVNAEKDKIKVHGKLIQTEVEPIYLALYKPKGVISALTDPEGRSHLGDFLHEIRERIIPIGRMDYNSEGLLLLTNDGDLADRVLKARDLPRVYMVKIKGHPEPKALEFLKNGIFTGEGVVRFANYNVEQTLKNKSWLKLEVVEGAHLDLRELLNHRGLLVDRIVRTAIGHLSVKGLEPGSYKILRKQDLERLVTAAQEKN